MKYRCILLLLIISCIATPLAAQMRNLVVKSYRIHSLTPTSIHSFNITAFARIQNDTCQFVMKNISGLLYKKGKPFLKGVVTDTVVPEGETQIRLCAHIDYCEGVSFFSLIGSLISRDLSDYSADIHMQSETIDGICKDVSKEGVVWDDFRH